MTTKVWRIKVFNKSSHRTQKIYTFKIIKAKHPDLTREVGIIWNIQQYTPLTKGLSDHNNQQRCILPGLILGLILFWTSNKGQYISLSVRLCRFTQIGVFKIHKNGCLPTKCLNKFKITADNIICMLNDSIVCDTQKFAHSLDTGKLHMIYICIYM